MDHDQFALWSFYGHHLELIAVGVVAEASATVWAEPLTIAKTVADVVVALKGLTPCEGKTAPDQAPRTTMRMRFPLLRNAVVRFGERIIVAAADGGSLDAEGNRPQHFYLA